MVESFDKTKELAEMKKSVLVFLKGDPKKAAGKVTSYDFDLF